MNPDFSTRGRACLAKGLALLALVLWLPLLGAKRLGSWLAKGRRVGVIRPFMLAVSGLLLLESVPVVRFLWARLEYRYELERLAQWSLDRSASELTEETVRLGLRKGFKELRGAQIDLDRSSEGGVDLCRLRVRFEHRVALWLLPSLPIKVDLRVRRAAEAQPRRPDPLGEDRP